MFPGFELNEDRVRQVIAYKRQLPVSLRHLHEDIAEQNNFADPKGVATQVPSDAPFAFKHAAELAFAINDVPLAIDIMIELLTSSDVHARTPMQLCLFGIFGAISGDFSVVVRPKSFSFERIKPFAVFSWPDHSVVAVEVARRMLTAAAASNLSNMDLSQFGNSGEEGSFGKAALLALRLTAEYQAVAGASDDRFVGFPRVRTGLTELDGRFAIYARQALSRTKLHPSIPKGLLDFGLLAIYVGLARQDRFEFLDRSDDLPEVTFLRKIAVQIAAATPFGQR